MKRNQKRHPLLLDSFEYISSDLFSNYTSAITFLIGKSSGVYALFNKKNLYYVGRATNLKSRVRQHLNDKHKKKWTHFSLYLIESSEHIGDIESLLVRIANPKGNVVKPRGDNNNKGERRLRKVITEMQRRELDILIPKKPKDKVPVKRRRIKKPDEESMVMKGLVAKPKRLYRTFHGKNYVAVLRPSGTLLFQKKKYYTPTSAAMVVSKGKNVNGWSFWKIRNEKGDLVKLKEIRKN